MTPWQRTPQWAILLLLLLKFAQHITPQAIDYTNHCLARITPQNEVQVKQLEEIGKRHNVGFWQDRIVANHPVFASLSPDKKDQVLYALKQQGIDYVVTSENIQQLINEEQAGMGSGGRSASYCDNPNFERYQTYDELVCIYEKMAQRYPFKIRMWAYGRTFQREKMYAVRLTSGGFNRPPVIFECGIHAREWIGPATCLWTVKTYLQSPPEWMNKYDALVMIHVNPDGYRMSHIASRYRIWRKNTRHNGFVSKRETIIFVSLRFFDL